MYKQRQMTKKNKVSESTLKYSILDIKLIDIAYLLAFASFFIPSSYAVKYPIYASWKFIVCSVSIVSISHYLLRRKISVRWIVLTVGIISYYLTSKIIMHSDGRLALALYNTLSVCGFITMLEMRLAEDFRKTLILFIIAGVLMCSINYISFILYKDIPGGMRSNDITKYKDALGAGKWFFFKHDNGTVFFYLPVLSCLWYYLCEFNKGKITTIIFSLATLYMYWSLWSVTAMIVTTIAVVFFVLIYILKGEKPFISIDYSLALIVAIGMSVLIVFMVTAGSEIIRRISIATVKSITFSGRQRIWEKSLEQIYAHPLLGVGYEHDMTSISKIYLNHCHNIILQMIYTGGIFTAALIIGGLFLCETKREGYHKHKTKGQMCLVASAFLIILASTIDWYLYIPIPFAVFLIYHFSYLSDKQI